MNSTKLEGDLQPILGSLGQFLLINIKISKFFYCNLNLLKFARILAKENIISVSIWDPTIAKILQTRNSWKHRFMFLPPLQKTFFFLHIHLVSSKNKLHVHKFFH